MEWLDIHPPSTWKRWLTIFFENIRITQEDIKISQDVYGNSIGYMKGKTINTKPIQVKLDIIKHYKQ